MRNFVSVLLLFISIGFFSCQKEINLDIISSGGSSGGSTNGDLLVKLDGRSGADSNVTYFTYNTAKQLVTTRNFISANGGSTNYYGFERNASGLIIRRKQFATTGLSPIPADTSITNYHYSTGTTPQITYSTSSISFMGFSVDDSTIYTYNTAGKLIKSDMYQSDLLSGSGSYRLASRYVYTYDAAGNATKLELFDFSSGTATLLSTNLFTYDTKTASIIYTEAESIAINDEPAATHNLTSLLTSASVVGTISSNFTFTYNNAGKPATGKQTFKQSGVTTVTNFTYYYQ